jgi:hypothetical protein
MPAPMEAHERATPKKSRSVSSYPPVIGALPPPQAAMKLKELGYLDEAKKIGLLSDERLSVSLWPGSDEQKPWQHTNHSFGFIPASDSVSSSPVPIVYAGNIRADKSLQNSRIKITLARLRAFDYPGRGLHRILLDFQAQNQVQDQTQALHFTQTYRVQQGEEAGIVGYPIFVGLNVGSEGVDFRCFTVNVQNDDDEKLLGFLDGDVFKQGMKLASSLNPVIPLMSGFAEGLVKGIASRHKNVPVQDIYMGLDFTNTPTGVRLAQGSYIAAQVPEKPNWDWSKWVFDPANGRIVSKDDPTKGIDHNYLVFSVSKMG